MALIDRRGWREESNAQQGEQARLLSVKWRGRCNGEHKVEWRQTKSGPLETREVLLTPGGISRRELEDLRRVLRLLEVLLLSKGIDFVA